MNKNMKDITRLQLGVYGDVKTCKTSLGLTFPKPLVHFDLDLSFERAWPTVPDDAKVCIVEFNQKLDRLHLKNNDIIVVRYRLPLKLESLGAGKLEGFLELWESRVIPDILEVYNTDRIASVQFDTGTILWSIAHQAHLERVQKRAEDKIRQSLLQIEYSRPNSEMSEIYGGARHYRKNLISLHHTGPKFGTGPVHLPNGRTEIRPNVNIGETWSGFSQMGRLVDVIGRTRLERLCNDCQQYWPSTTAGPGPHTGHSMGSSDTPVFTVEHCGLTLAMNEMKLSNPSFEALLKMINTMRSI